LPPDCHSSIINCGTVRPVAFYSQIWTDGFSLPQYGHFSYGNPQSSCWGLPWYA
jgi:hypothetical protein